MNETELNGRRLHHWIGKDREADTAALTDAIVAAVELFNDNGRLVRLDKNGELVSVNRSGLHELISERICGMQVVKRGTRWVREYYSYEFAVRPHPGPPRPEDYGKQPDPEREPDASVLDDIYRHRLLSRIPRVE